jgi:hypothetical protein
MIEAGAPSARETVVLRNGVCSAHRGWSWSHRPRSRATLAIARAQSEGRAKELKKRGQGQYKGRSPLAWEPRPYERSSAPSTEEVAGVTYFPNLVILSDAFFPAEV